MKPSTDLSDFESSYRRRKSSYLSLISPVTSRRSSLYDSIASLNLNVPSIFNLDTLQIEDIVAKNREISDFISNRLTSLIYFSSELAGGHDRDRSVRLNESCFDGISEDPKEYLENEDTFPTEAIFVKDICQKIVNLAKCYETKERYLEKNREEIKNLEDELAELNQELEEFVRNRQEIKIEVSGLINSCRCEVI